MVNYKCVGRWYDQKRPLNEKAYFRNFFQREIHKGTKESDIVEEVYHKLPVETRKKLIESGKAARIDACSLGILVVLFFVALIILSWLI